MSDLLDREESGPRARPRRRSRLVALTVFLLVLVLLAVLAVVGGRALVHALRPSGSADFAGPGNDQVLVEVHRGDTATNIATTLHDQGVVRSEGAFRKAAKAEPRSVSIQPGFYDLRKGMSASAAVALLLDPASRARSRVTLPEGLSVAEALPRTAEATGVDLAKLKAAAAAPAALDLPAYAHGQLEGFLYPATYDIEPGTAAVDVLRLMTTRFSDAAAGLDLEARAAAIGQTPQAVVITASLIEKETAFPADRAKVARVVYNHLADRSPLKFDSTVNYARGQDKKARLSNDDTRIASPYNTYLHEGLPPTPIDSPGEAALEAALHPADGDWLYFVLADKNGSAFFTSDYAAFEVAKAKAQQQGLY